MNSFTNSILLFFSIPLIGFCIYVGFDVQIDFLHTSGGELPFQSYVYLSFGILFFGLLGWRSVRRWMGLYIVNKRSRFAWNMPVSKKRKQRVISYTLLEVLVMTSLAYALYSLMSTWILPTAVLVFFSIESFVFLFSGMNKRFRVGISSKAIIAADREVVIVYFTGLQKITLGKDSIYFDYIKELQLLFPTDCLEEDELASFKKVVQQMIDRDKVLIRNID
ncbi:MAG: hypothetical protein QNK70_07205 [Crocinitomicaceae bacterium]|tara:strand:+ start:6246 stop:6908 length:663 start_codon:yes stop_codon:yes gene_type:complete